MLILRAFNSFILAVSSIKAFRTSNINLFIDKISDLVDYGDSMVFEIYRNHAFAIHPERATPGNPPNRRVRPGNLNTQPLHIREQASFTQFAGLPTGLTPTVPLFKQT